jgi:hypothetical protein
MAMSDEGNIMVARVPFEMNVGITAEMQTAMRMVCDFTGMRPAQYARQALLEKLVRDRAIASPMDKYTVANEKTA